MEQHIKKLGPRYSVLQSYHGFKIWAWSKNAPIELILNMSDHLAKTIVHVKYEHNQSRPKIKNPDNFAIMKNAAPNFLYVGLLMLSYLKSGPKVRGRWEHWDSFLTGTSFFKSSLCNCVWA